MTVGDFNYDGNPDLAVVNNEQNGSVSVLLGDGFGSFESVPRSRAAAKCRRGDPELARPRSALGVCEDG